MFSRQRLVSVLSILVPLVLAGQVTRACSTPVFQYALERWPPDPYRIELTGGAPTSDEGKALAEELRSAGLEGDGFSNHYVRVAPESRAAEGAPGPTKMAVHLPAATGTAKPIWERELTTETIADVVDSPLRKEIGRRLTGGESAVWVFLESGNRERDSHCLETLTRELGDFDTAHNAQAEKLQEAGAAEMAGAAAVSISFSVAKLKRDDPAEQFLVDMLLSTEPDLRSFKEPIVFPVFGQGRALYALVGKGISQENIHDACYFLTGACSCEVKALNPGVDLLMSVDWAELSFEPAYTEEPLPPLTGVLPVAAGEAPDTGPEEPDASGAATEELVPAEEGLTPAADVPSGAPPPGKGGLLWRNVTILAVFGFGLVVALSAAMGFVTGSKE